MWFGRRVPNRRADEAEDGFERLQRHVVRQIAEPCLREPAGTLCRFPRPHPRGHRGEPGKVVDLTEQVVVAHERCEHQWRETRARLLVRVQVHVQRVFVERARDDASCLLDILGAQRQYGRSFHTAPLSWESPR